MKKIFNSGKHDYPHVKKLPIELIISILILMFCFTMSLAGQRIAEVKTVQSIEALQEVVVVGYGTTKKVNVIGSVAQVTSETIENRSVSSVSNALTGQMTGVTVIQRSGKPGFDGGEIRIRGVGSFGATPS